MRIALFDYRVSPTNPTGSCHLKVIARLCHEHEITVFAVRFENPCPERIRFVRIPVPNRPLVLLFALFHLIAPIVYWLHILRTRARFDLVQMVESNLLIGDLSYSHFCHRRFLVEHWKATGATGLRGLLRWMDHRAHAIVEPWVYHRVRRIIVPSRGLARELAEAYPSAAGKIRVVPNPVDLERLSDREGFDRAGFRSELGFQAGDSVLLFVALGHFERKGLPLLIEALRDSADPSTKLLVVGGESGLVATYRKRVDASGLTGRVVFTGMQQDVRPYFWAADAFVLPSVYEVFPLVALQAAAAGLPLIVPALNGVEEFLRDGRNGFLVERSVEGVTAGIERFKALDEASRAAMSAAAQADVQPYSSLNFCDRWRELYDEMDAIRRKMFHVEQRSVTAEPGGLTAVP